jgi:hypothetical protein
LLSIAVCFDPIGELLQSPFIFFHVTSFCRRSHASTFQYRRMESNIFKKLAKQPDGRLLQKHGQCSRVVRMDRRNTRGFLRVYRIVERKERVRRVM